MASLEEIAEVFSALNPAGYRKRSGEWIRGGLPGSSMRDGSPSADTPNVGLDGADVVMLLAVNEYNENFAKAVAILAEADVCSGKPRDKLLGKAIRFLERNRVLETALPPLHPTRGGDTDIYKKWHKEMARRNADEKVKPGANCSVCGEFVDNIGENRIKAGKCPRCYQAKKAQVAKGCVTRDQRFGIVPPS